MSAPAATHHARQVSRSGPAENLQVRRHLTTGPATPSLIVKEAGGFGAPLFVMPKVRNFSVSAAAAGQRPRKPARAGICREAGRHRYAARARNECGSDRVCSHGRRRPSRTLSIALAALTLATQAEAQWPARRVNIIVICGGGGGADLVAR